MANFFRVNSPAGDYVDRLIPLAKTPQELENVARRVQCFLVEERPAISGKSPQEKKEEIVILTQFKEAMTVLRDEYKRCLAETTLETMVHSVVKDRFGKGDADSKVVLRRRKEIEALMANDVSFENEGQECAALKGETIDQCLKEIDLFIAALNGKTV